MPNKKQTVSFSRGRTAIEHDLREHIPANADSSMTHFNVVLVNELKGRTLAEYTNDYMKQFIEEYNKKQRRTDRKKSFDYASSYVEEQNKMATSRQNYTAGQLAYEYVVQFGDHQTMNVNEVVSDKETYMDVVNMFEEFIEEYKKHYPHMKIILASVHMDEPRGTPHMHVLVQPIGEGYKQGLSHQVSLTKALSCDGFERSTKKGDRLSMTRWQDDIKDNIMENILYKHHYTREYKDGEKQHMPVEVYKKAMEEKERIIEDAKYEAEYFDKERDRLYNGDKTKDGFEAMSVWELSSERERLVKRCDNLMNGFDKDDGSHVPGYIELVEKNRELEDKHRSLQTKLKEYGDDPDKLLETKEGQKALEKAENRIVEKVQNNIFQQFLGFVQKEIFDKLKRSLIEPIFQAINGMMYERGYYVCGEDKPFIQEAVYKAVDDVTSELHIGEGIRDMVKEEAKDVIPKREEVVSSVRRIRRRGR